jgi:hypothetical protein
MVSTYSHRQSRSLDGEEGEGPTIDEDYRRSRYRLHQWKHCAVGMVSASSRQSSARREGGEYAPSMSREGIGGIAIVILVGVVSAQSRRQ